MHFEYQNRNWKSAEVDARLSAILNNEQKPWLASRLEGNFLGRCLLNTVWMVTCGYFTYDAKIPANYDWEADRQFVVVCRKKKDFIRSNGKVNLYNRAVARINMYNRDGRILKEMKAVAKLRANPEAWLVEQQRQAEIARKASEDQRVRAEAEKAKKEEAYRQALVEKQRIQQTQEEAAERARQAEVARRALAIQVAQEESRRLEELRNAANSAMVSNSVTPERVGRVENAYLQAQIAVATERAKLEVEQKRNEELRAEEARRAAEEASRRRQAEETALRQAEERRRQQEVQARREAEEKARAAEARKRAEEDVRRREAEAARVVEEQRRREEAARQEAERQRAQQAEQARRAAEMQARDRERSSRTKVEAPLASGVRVLEPEVKVRAQKNDTPHVPPSDGRVPLGRQADLPPRPVVVSPPSERVQLGQLPAGATQRPIPAVVPAPSERVPLGARPAVGETQRVNIVLGAAPIPVPAAAAPSQERVPLGRR